MLKFGVISEIDLDKGLARVNFAEDDFVSSWLKISVMRSGPDQITFPFDINENVWCMMDERCEYGVIGGAYYDETNLPEGSGKGKLSFKFADNSVIEYDRISHILKLDIKGKADIKCTGTADIQATSVNITAAETSITGILKVSGAATIQGVVSVGGLAGISGGPVQANDAVINAKEIIASDVLRVGGIDMKTHKHLSATSGSPTGEPLP